MIRDLDAVSRLMKWAETRKIDLAARIESLDLLSDSELFSLVEWFRIRRPVAAKAGRQVVATATTFARLLAVRAYLRWRIEPVIHRLSNRDPRRARAGNELDRFSGKIIRLAGRPRRGRQRLGLPPDLRKRFLEIIAPDHPENPFQVPHRQRNFVLLTLYYETGCRRAEALSLKGQDLQLTGVTPLILFHRRADDPEDSRRYQPLAKTRAHPYPAGMLLAELLTTFVIESRPRYPHHNKSPFIFLARSGRPMSLKAVDHLFVLIRDRHPEFPRDFSPHILRHTWNDRFSEAVDAGRAAGHKITDTREKQLRNEAQGWSRRSTQGEGYSVRATRAEAQSLMLSMQDQAAARLR